MNSSVADNSSLYDGAAGLSIPRSPAAITAEWLTTALRSSGVIYKSVVASSEFQSIGEGKGFTGQLARFKLVYDNYEKHAPTSLIAKFPTENPRVRTSLNFSRLYEREARFYEAIAPRVELRTPRCYYSAVNAEQGDSILLMEDLGDVAVSANPDSCSLENALYAVRQLAAFHARWWQSPELENFTWMPAINDGAEYYQALVRRIWQPYLEIIGADLPSQIVGLGDKLRDNVAGIRKRLGLSPQTITHGDFRADNFFFTYGPHGTSFVVIDWQVAMRGPGISDIAYFLVYCFPSDRRREHEKRFLQTYHSALLASGVADYDFHQCVRDYKLSLLNVLIRMVIQGSFLNLASKQSQALHKVGLQRCASALEDHNVTELVSSLNCRTAA